jgi:two-component system OmpR family response regulator
MSESRCRILYVDDHEDSAEMFRLLVSSPDYEVETAQTIAEALERATTAAFDLYVLDKRLPDGTGMELCVRLNEMTPGVPCIFYTGDAYEVHRQEVMVAGATAYVPKPHVDALIATVHKVLSERECAAA